MEKRTAAADMRRLWPMVIVGGCFLLGGVLGCLFAAAVTGDSAEQLRSFLTDYIELSRNAAAEVSVWRIAWSEGRWLLLCAFLGLSGLGAAALPVVFVLRGFLFAFGAGCFVRFLGVLGFIPACVVFALPALLWMPSLFLCGILGLSAGFRSVKGRSDAALLVSGAGFDRRAGIAVSMLMFLLCVLIEWGLLPALLPLAARILG